MLGLPVRNTSLEKTFLRHRPIGAGTRDYFLGAVRTRGTLRAHPEKYVRKFGGPLQDYPRNVRLCTGTAPNTSPSRQPESEPIVAIANFAGRETDERHGSRWGWNNNSRQELR
jgi:hypothetical protein